MLARLTGRSSLVHLLASDIAVVQQSEMSEMLEHSISDPNESMMTSAGGRAVLPETSFSQADCCIAHYVKCSPMM